MTVYPSRLERGSPYPLGASFDGLGVNFAVFSGHAERVELCLFDPRGRREVARIGLPECTDEVWHGYLPEAGPGLAYGYRAHGRYAPLEGHRFNPNKLLLDPYARATVGSLKWTDALHSYRVSSRKGDLSFCRRDSAPAMPKAVVTADAFDWSGDVRPNVPWDETVIYEGHVRGLTRLMDDVSPPERGSFAGLASPALIAHLKRIGVTALELMPIQAFTQDRFLQEKGLANYWGYNTLSFFAPEARYMASGSADELRIAIRKLHAAGIEVILDVVYNHTAEGSELGPTLSWRGLDNASYYRLLPDDPRRAINDTGTGNTLNLSHPRVLQMVTDSLRYWATSFRVDGFRFDLGLTLGRTPEGFDQNAAFFQVLRQDPVLAPLKLISEPWDVGPGGYQLGNHPPGFAEWNDRFRDTTRRFWRGDAGVRADFAARAAGSSDLFAHRARRPWASVNFIASHDGQPLADVVAYEERHNEANGEDNRDGHDANYSCNWGVEGPTDDAKISEVRARVARSMLTTLFASLGTPMLPAGDEFGRTQQGNNNAYAQDNALSWLDWELAASEPGAALTDFVARLAALRREHALLRSGHFLYGNEIVPGVRDLEWFDEAGNGLSDADWQNPEGRALAMRRACRTADGRIEALTLLVNGSHLPISFALPGGAEHRLLIDSADPDAAERAIEEPVEVVDRGAMLIHSMLVT